jgi:hypothetical protein
MPYKTEWVDPDLLLRHEDVKVFHCYDEDKYDSPLEYFYTVYSDNYPVSEANDFDVRDLSGYKGDHCEHRRVIIDAIDSGELTCHGIFRKPE